MGILDFLGFRVKGAGLDDYFDEYGRKVDNKGDYWSANDSEDHGWTTLDSKEDGWINYHEHYRDGEADTTHGWDYKSSTKEEIEYKDTYKRGGKDKDSSKAKHKSGSSDICYIATATLIMDGSETQLNLLRNWRDEFLLPKWWGKFLVGYYYRSAPPVAQKAKQNRWLAFSFLYPFVKPAIWVLRANPQNDLTQLIQNIVALTIFCIGLLYGSIVGTVFRFSGKSKF